ncbi:hypothetical protein GCM10008986_31120 [Salinibacillus aidingensis]|uniref:Uncharacterized protein n=1 Tax=Salinibacillus aidingensis TaxID=237684 RepID=A0ABN1BNV7_9BACI
MKKVIAILFLSIFIVCVALYVGMKANLNNVIENVLAHNPEAIKVESTLGGMD